jgi:F-type H+-transporting ATPase subunit b
VKKRPFAIAIAVSFVLATAVAAAQEHGGTTHGPTHGGAAENTSAAPHEAGESHEGAEHEHGPAPLNLTDISDKHRPALIAILVNFGILVSLYYYMGKKPIAEALRQRRITIGKDIEDAQKMLEEAKERAKKYQGDLKNADVDAATAKSALVTAGKGEVERMIADAQEKAERMKRDAERLVEQERKQAREDLLRETVDLAVDHATKLLEKNVTAEDHQRFAQDLLAELAKRPGAKSSGSVAPRAGGAS